MFQNSVAPKARIEIQFKDQDIEHFATKFKTQMEAKFASWKPRVEKPSLSIS